MKYVLALTLLLVSSMCMASDAAKRESVDELMQITGVDSMVDAMYSQMEGMLQGMSQQMGVQPDEKSIYDAYHKKMVALMRTEMSWDKMKEPMTEIYLSNFNEKEIQGMLDFYKSEVGKATLEKLPVVMQQSMQVGQKLAQNMMPKIQGLAEELKAELEKHRQEKNRQEKAAE